MKIFKNETVWYWLQTKIIDNIFVILKLQIPSSRPKHNNFKIIIACNQGQSYLKYFFILSERRIDFICP